MHYLTCIVQLSDHFPVFYSLNISPPSVSLPSKHLTRSIHSINVHNFMLDIISSSLITRHPPSDLSGLVDCYNSTSAALLNKHAPLKSTTSRTKPSTKRLLERVWSQSHSAEDLKFFRSATIDIMLLS